MAGTIVSPNADSKRRDTDEKAPVQFHGNHMQHIAYLEIYRRVQPEKPHTLPSHYCRFGWHCPVLDIGRKTMETVRPADARTTRCKQPHPHENGVADHLRHHTFGRRNRLAAQQHLHTDRRSLRTINTKKDFSMFQHTGPHIRRSPVCCPTGRGYAPPKQTQILPPQRAGFQPLRKF